MKDDINDYTTEEIVEVMSRSIMNLGLHTLKRFNKEQLILIILRREALLYEKINEFDDSMKHNDRKVFKNLKTELKELQEHLLKKNKTYLELQNYKKKNKELKILIKSILLKAKGRV